MAGCICRTRAPIVPTVRFTTRVLVHTSSIALPRGEAETLWSHPDYGQESDTFEKGRIHGREFVIVTFEHARKRVVDMLHRRTGVPLDDIPVFFLQGMPPENTSFWQIVVYEDDVQCAFTTHYTGNGQLERVKDLLSTRDLLRFETPLQDLEAGRDYFCGIQQAYRRRSLPRHSLADRCGRNLAFGMASTVSG